MQLKKYQFSGNFDWFVTGLAANRTLRELRITSGLPVTRDNRQTPENAFASGFAEHPG
ncbi:hypothetical protein [Tunturiibacter gelidoferens]|uniref:Uncharacterized protein n=2 Tax=Tunturiibacter TaxID=3154218 RepID=A0A7Y9NI98_9BACT|nr:hypothetical protein [Edaphobacter lichenicola]NYF49819.1 hypothetical protein [Edaphobacter lichenicola]